MKPVLVPVASHWIIGTLVAFAGVMVVRLIGPQCGDPARTWITVAGELLGLSGLLVIALGVRRRLHLRGVPAVAAHLEESKPD